MKRLPVNDCLNFYAMTQHIRIVLSLTLMLLLCNQASIARSGNQNLDSRDTPSNTTAALGRAIAVQPDGKILVAGITHRRNVQTKKQYTAYLPADFALARYNKDGTLDNSFGEGGKVVTDFGGNYDIIQAIALQPDGRIVVAGYTVWDRYDTDFALARYNKDGTPDLSFGDGGRVVTDFFGKEDRARCIVIREDGRIVAAGSALNDQIYFALARYTSDGKLDRSFGTEGKLWNELAKFYTVSDIVFHNNQQFVVAAAKERDYRDGQNYTTSFLLFRYHSDGRLDTTFGKKGKVTVPSTTRTDIGKVVALQSDGKILLAGWPNVIARSQPVAITRYNRNGRQDKSFGEKAGTAIPFPQHAMAKRIAIQSNGGFIIAGDISNYLGSPGLTLVLTRYDKDGRLDSSFGEKGKVITPYNGFSTSFAIAFQPDGKIIMSGHSKENYPADFMLARYEATGSLDSEFGSQGTVYTNFYGITDKAPAFTLARDEKRSSKKVLSGVPGEPPPIPLVNERGVPSSAGENRSRPARVVDSTPIPLNRPRPNYTEKARRNKVEGTVQMRVLVGADGSVKDVQVIAHLPDGLEEEAIRTMYQTRFKPAMKNGQPVEYWMQIAVEFNLR